MTDPSQGAATPQPLDMDLSPGCFHLVEASAGTGKTWLTTALVLRLVTEECVPIERILVMTFTRAATAELADRVRSRLRGALDALETGSSPDPHDQAFARLLAHPDRKAFPARLRAALASFDLAPISTIHGFCQRTLARYALEAGVDPRPQLLTETTALRERLVADSVVAAWAPLDAAGATALSALKFEARTLHAIANSLSGAVAPTIDPPSDAQGTFEGQFTTFIQALAIFRVTLAQNGDRWWKSYESSGNTYISTFGKSQATAYEKLCEAVEGGSPVDCSASNLKWFVESEVKAKISLADFGGLPLMQAFAPLRAAAQALCAGCGPTSAFARNYRARWDALLQERGVLTYDSMLATLAGALDPTRPGAAQLRAALAGEYEAALVDEFQDTDAAQWLALREVFGAPDKRLVVVGDPKQAIYSFRGADIEVYTAATQGGAGTAQPTHWTLPRNFRTDPALIKVLDTLWRDDKPAMGAGIAVPKVEAAKPDRVIAWGEVAARQRRPLELRLFTSTLLGSDEESWPNKEDAQAPIAADCARVCAELIGTLSIAPKPKDVEPLTFKIAARHIAILVRTGKQGRMVLDALRKVGIHAVLSSRESVFSGEAARWLIAWLDAVADAGREVPARILALTPLVGFAPLELGHAVLQQQESDAAPIAGSPAARFETLRRQLRRDAELWPKRGFMSLFERFLAEHGAWERVRNAAAGERAATDLRQLIDVLHAEERAERDGVAALAARVRARLASTAGTEAAGDDPAAQHLESDADAVRILTQHVSKGLQFPVVLLPYSWDHHSISDKGQPLRQRGQPDANGLPRPRLHLSAKDHPTRDQAKNEAQAIDDEEAMRLLYVAMTRAEHHLVVWVGRSGAAAKGALDRRLGVDSGEPARVRAHLQALAETHPELGYIDVPPLGGTSRLERIEQDDGRTPQYAPPIDRLRNGWMKTSYTGLSRTIQVTPAEDALSALVTAPPPLLTTPAAGSVLPRGGTVTGSFVHRMLELVDFAANDETNVMDAIRRAGHEHGFGNPEQQRIVRDLLPGWLDTPLDHAPAPAVSDPGSSPTGGVPALPGGFSLRALRRADRLDELAFDLSLGGAARIQPGAARAVFDAAKDSPSLSHGTRAWVRSLLARTNAEGEAATIVGAMRGVLNGSIDLVFRTGTAQAPVFWVADYKTNAIRGPKVVQDWAQAHRETEGPPPAGSPWRDPLMRSMHFTRPVLDWEMSHHAYPLQTFLYTVALHRYLRQRMGLAYSYDTHIGGCLWLFLRGMGGAVTPRHDGDALGVWRERWPAHLVEALDAALNGATVDQLSPLLSAPSPRSCA